MNRTYILYVLAMIVLAFNTACDRATSGKTSITIQMPSEMEKRIADSKVSSMTTISLRHLALQVTAPDLPKAYTKILDGERAAAGLTSITLDEELPFGDNRLIQLVAAYGSEDTDTPDIFYGDVTVSLRRSIENIELPVTRLGAGTQKMTEVAGRFLTSANSGPTGILNMIYRPTGKPEMILDKNPIVAGWFRLSIFESLAMDYITDAGVVIGQQWTNSSISTSNSVIRISTPSGFSQYWSQVGNTYRAHDAREDVFGFFASDSSFLSNKKVCVTAGLPNGGTIHSARALQAENPISALPFKHFAAGTTPTLTANQVTISGGLPRSSCGVLLPANEFDTYLWFMAGSQPSSHDDYSRLLGLNEGFASNIDVQEYNYQFNRYNSPFEYSATFGGMFARLTVLPGYQNFIDQVQIYENANYGSSGDDRCDRLNAASWQAKKIIPALFVGNNLIIKASDLTTGVNSGVCLMSQGKLVGRIKHLNYYSSTFAPATQVQWGYRKLPTVDECGPLSLNLNASTGIPYLNQDPATFTVHAQQSGVDFAILYPTGDCSGSPVANLNLTYTRGKTSKTVYVKSPTPVSFDLTVSTALPGIALPSLHSVSVASPSGTAVAFHLQPNYFLDPGDMGPLQMYPFQCLPLRVQATNSSGYGVPLDATISLSLKDLAGNTATAPSGFGFYETCASSTPISSIAPSSDEVKTFVVKTGAAVPTDMKIHVAWSSWTTASSINAIPRTKKLAWQLGTATPLTGQCVSATLKTLDTTNNPVAVNAHVYAHFSATAAEPQDIQIFSDSSCGVRIHEGAIAQGTSQSVFYIRTSKAGSNFYLRAHSDQANQDADLNFSSTASTMTITGPASAVANQALDFVIIGGTPPYSFSAVDGNINGTPNYYWNNSTNRYHISAQVISGATPGSTVNFTVNDSSGQTFTPSFTIVP